MPASKAFFDAYVACALWSSNDESRDDGGDPLDDNYDATDIAPETLAKMRADCDAFANANEGPLYLMIGSTPRYHGREYTEADAGQDFWLSRNGHGAGFFDNSEAIPPERGVWEFLQDAAEAFGEVNLYAGDDGKVHST